MAFFEWTVKVTYVVKLSRSWENSFYEYTLSKILWYSLWRNYLEARCGVHPKIQNIPRQKECYKFGCVQACFIRHFYKVPMKCLISYLVIRQWTNPNLQYPFWQHILKFWMGTTSRKFLQKLYRKTLILTLDFIKFYFK